MIYTLYLEQWSNDMKLIVFFAFQIATYVHTEPNGLCFIGTEICAAHREWSGNHDDSSYAVSIDVDGQFL